MIAVETEEEAHYVCAVLNSEPVHRLVAAHSVRGGKGFGTPSMLDYLPIRRYDPGCSVHAELAALSLAAHPVAARAGDAASLQRQIDRHVAALWQADAAAFGNASPPEACGD